MTELFDSYHSNYRDVVQQDIHARARQPGQRRTRRERFSRAADDLIAHEERR